jgi:hypothetical protein
MKVVASYPHSEFNITIFAWNHKYLVKFEKDNLEQVYKISEYDLTGQEEIDTLLQNDDFLNTVAQRFEDMQEDLNEALGMD